MPNDQRNNLQQMFQDSHRFANFGDVIIKMRIKGFRCHSDTTIEVQSPITAFCGLNGTGKSTLLQLAATAYASPSNATRKYIKDFIIAGKLDRNAFTDTSSIQYEYMQPVTTDGHKRTKTITVSRSSKSSRWAGYRNQPKRRVFFAGVGLYLPRIEQMDAVIRHAAELQVNATAPISNEEKTIISNILGTAYTSANENDCAFYGKSQKLITVDKRNANYSEINMGCGEGRIYHLVRIVEALPDKSLILMEEPEISLHPSAQYKFGQYLVDVCCRKKHQVFLTTHSEALMNAFHEQSRIFLHHSASGLQTIPGIGVGQAMSLMSDQRTDALRILVEDDVAEALVIELLRQQDELFLKTVSVFIAGNDTQIANLMKFFSAQQAYKTCAVRDGDKGEMRPQKMFKLFGSEAPEKEIFHCRAFQEMVESKWHIRWSDIEATIAGKDHHEWFGELERLTKLKRDVVLHMAAEEYLGSILAADRADLVQKLKGVAN